MTNSRTNRAFRCVCTNLQIWQSPGATKTTSEMLVAVVPTDSPAKLLSLHRLCDALPRGHGDHVLFGNFSPSRDQSADGQHQENHDAELQQCWLVHGHENGHPVLIRAVVAHYIHHLQSVPAYVL